MRVAIGEKALLSTNYNHLVVKLFSVELAVSGTIPLGHL